MTVHRVPLLCLFAVLLSACGSAGARAPHAAVTTEPPPPSSPPGPEIADASTPGQGACTGRTFGDAREAVRAHWRSNFKPRSYGDEGQSEIHGFAAPAGFAFVVFQGSMDCPEGCLVREYWYYETNGACAPVNVGYHAVDPFRFRKCGGRDVVGRPRWGVPEFGPSPEGHCNPAAAPASLSGTYRLRAVGHRRSCLPKKGDPKEPQEISLPVTMQVRQGWWRWRHEGTVTFHGTGDARIDGQPMQARFTRRRIRARAGNPRPRSPCASRHVVRVDIDLGSGQPGTLSFDEGSLRPCTPQPPCLGDLELSLTLQATPG